MLSVLPSAWALEKLKMALRHHFDTSGWVTLARQRLVVPSRESALIAVAAKGFDSTGSKLTDSVREIEEMAAIRLPRQYVMAVIDGIGWKSRAADLRRIYSLWEREEIDGMYSLASMDRFRADLREAARLRGLLPQVDT